MTAGRPSGVIVIEFDELGRQADLNLAGAWATMGSAMDARVVGSDEFTCVVTGIPAAFFNGAYATGKVPDPDARIREAAALMAGHGVAWLLWVREGVDDDLLAAGRRAGLTDVGGPPCMGLADIPPSPPLPAGLVVGPVATAADIDACRDLTARGFEMPLEIARRLMNERTIAEPGIVAVVGRVDDVAVSTALVCVTGATAGIYNVATPPEHRRRGYGAALTWAAIAEGARLGAEHAVLQASPMGRPVYEAMGFVGLGSYVQLQGPPPPV